MSRRKQLKKEAAQARGRIDCYAGFIRQRIDSLIRRVCTFARRPAALPVAFVCGLLAGRLRAPGIKGIYRLIAGLVAKAKALQMASGLIGTPVR